MANSLYIYLQKYRQGFITSPIVLAPHHTVQDVQKVKESYGFSGIPITDTGKMGGKLMGLITARDVDFLSEEQYSTSVSKVRVIPEITASSHKDSYVQSYSHHQTNSYQFSTVIFTP